MRPRHYSRRAALSSFVAALLSRAANVARADSSDAGAALELRSLRVGNASETGSAEHDVVLALPTRTPRAAPLVILLHGLAETADERLGSHAWIDRYGLTTSVARLASPPLARLRPHGRDDWGDAALRNANDALAAHPYQGLAFACPFVPRLREDQLTTYARWLTDSLVPRIRDEAGARIDPAQPRIAGCSFGAWVALEVALRAPGAFRAYAGVQTAIGKASAARYADRLARLASSGPFPLLFETSTQDPFHDPTLALAAALRTRGVSHELIVLPGPHDQPWLRESGTPSLLLWLDKT
jgi:hypothetical protein